MEAFSGHLPKISLQKLLFLLTIRQAKPEYEFIPYLYGCYSFSAEADLKAMVKRDYLKEEANSYSLNGAADYILQISESDRAIIFSLTEEFKECTPESLMKFTYLNYQYYAINSIKAQDFLNEYQFKEIKDARPIANQIALFTIGYEGISLEEYLNRLIKNDVKVLVDVRSNPLSMKFGFSKSKLKNFCSSLNIEYLHIPEVGIKSDQRKNLQTQEDYDSLFEIYKASNLQHTLNHQQRILGLLRDKKRIALTCFEANVCQCHRKHLAEAIVRLAPGGFEVKHI